MRQDLAASQGHYPENSSLRHGRVGVAQCRGVRNTMHTAAVAVSLLSPDTHIRPALEQCPYNSEFGGCNAVPLAARQH